MAKTVRWHGSEKLQIQPDLKIVERADSITTTISYRGPYTECVAKKPAIGQSIKGFLGFIDGVDLAREDGTIGTITVTIKQGVGDELSTTNAAEVTWELHWEKIQKPLIAHPRYTKLNAGYGDPVVPFVTTETAWESVAAGVTTVGAIMLQLASMATTQEREAVLTDGTTDPNQVTLVRDYLKKLGRGTEGYNAFTPTIRKVTTSPKRPTATGAGFLLAAGTTPGGPLIASIPEAASYRWFKDDDAVTKTGGKSTYERTEVWLAVDDADQDLYKTP